jgi:8-oxo-dGTP diphosphatase
MPFIYSYPRPAVTVDALVFSFQEDELYILLVKRKNEPFRNCWALPGGFAGMDETLETACRRELEEETGIMPRSMEQFMVFDAPGRDPRGRTISVVFHTCLDEMTTPKGGDDASEARWFPVSGLPQLAFDHHEIVGRFLSIFSSWTQRPPAVKRVPE